jgi:uncharacterized delta-60 repeat protein
MRAFRAGFRLGEHGDDFLRFAFFANEPMTSNVGATCLAAFVDHLNCAARITRKILMLYVFPKRRDTVNSLASLVAWRSAIAVTRQRLSAIFLSVAALALTSAAMAITGQPGTLDAFWATGSAIGAGKRMTAISEGDDLARAMVLQPDGKVVLAGACEVGGGFGFCAARYLSDGNLDLSFATALPIGPGRVITSFSNLNGDEARAVALQPDGKIVLAGQCWNGTYYDFCALRYNADGTLDSGFATASALGVGKVRTAIGARNNLAYAALIQTDGKIVLAGQCQNAALVWEFCALRYHANGTLDASFAASSALGAGKLMFAIGTLGDQLRAAALQVDGNLVFSGHCYNGVNEDFCAARVLSDGGIDTSFAATSPLGGGKVITDINLGNDYADALAIEPDGHIVLAGNCKPASGAVAFCAVRYRADGTLDTIGMPFTGKTISGERLIAYFGRAALVQPDGKLLIAGHCNFNLDSDFCMRRLNSAGSLDLSFSGIPLNFLGGDDSIVALALQSDGKVIAAGQCSNGSDLDFCVSRFEGGPFGARQCSLDIDGDGKVLALTDSLIHARIALGIRGGALTTGISFPAGATRTSWTPIRDYLVTQCNMTLPM